MQMCGSNAAEFRVQIGCVVGVRHVPRLEVLRALYRTCV